MISFGRVIILTVPIVEGANQVNGRRYWPTSTINCNYAYFLRYMEDAIKIFAVRESSDEHS